MQSQLTDKYVPTAPRVRILTMEEGAKSSCGTLVLEDRCACCGREIEEGQMVCAVCKAQSGLKRDQNTKRQKPIRMEILRPSASMPAETFETFPQGKQIDSDLDNDIVSKDRPVKAKQGKYYYRALCGVILTAICSGAFWYVWREFVQRNNQTGHLTGLGNLLMSLLIYASMVVFSFHALGGFKIGVNRKMNIISSQIVALFCVNLIEVFISMAITGQFRFGPVLLGSYFLLFVVQSALVILLTIPMISIYRRIFPPLRLIEIYGDYINHLGAKVNERSDKYNVCRLIDCAESEEYIKGEIQHYDAVLLNDLPSQAKNRILKICFDLNKRVYFTPKISDIIVKSSEELNLFDTPLFLCRNIGITPRQRFIKRFFDIVLSALALILLSPLLLGVAIAIKIEDGGPVFFRQERVTIGGKTFLIQKFRSMIVDAEKDGKPHPAGEKDDRITKVGKFIRPTRIDELPQLINILMGDMSIVGPRPERCEFNEQYTQEVPEFKFRLKVKGGLTGYAQVYGKYNTTPLDKLKLDMIYIMNYSLLLDVQIIFETVKVLFQKESTEGFSEERQKAVHNFEL